MVGFCTKVRRATAATLFIAVLLVASSAGAIETRRWLYGSLIGLGIGAGAGVGIGYAACDSSRGSGGFCTNRAAGMTYLGVAFAAFGFGVGGVINYAVTKPKPEVEPTADALAPGAILPSLWVDPKRGGGISAAMVF